jgi:hypothetical protein
MAIKEAYTVDYVSAQELADKWGVTRRWIQNLCIQGRIEGANKIGNMWLIPFNAERPKDDRIVSGKYVKKTLTGF